MLKLLSLFALLAFSPLHPTDYVEVEITNPCTRSVEYGYNSHTLKPEVQVDNYGSVEAGKSKKIAVPMGCYLKFSRKGAGCVTMLGKVEYKGQRFAMDCQ